MRRKIRVLVGKPGLDGHDRGAKVVAAALRDAGMEVIYTGLHQTAEQIVEAAVQEDVDVVALSILSGAHMTLFPATLELMQAKGIGDRLLTGGGIIPSEDMATLAGLGVGKLFGPGASTQDIATYIRAWFRDTHGEDALEAPPADPLAAVQESFAPPARTSAAEPRSLARSRPARAAAPRPTAKPKRAAAKAKRAARPKRATKPKPAAAKHGTRKSSARRAAPRRAAAARTATRRAPARRSTASRTARKGAGKRR